MASVHDVAAYILKETGPMTAMKLQKLIYYCQSWSLVWDDRPLFQARIEAWANGPVSPEIYRHHRGRYQVSAWPKGNTASLKKAEHETVDAVLHYYGKKSSHWLSELTHQERPWRDARKSLAPGQRGSEIISTASMAEYYGSLV